jgi:hypothetical protein
VAAILMDLSKAIDCLPHDILLSKLAAYELSSQSVNLLENYFTDRKHQIILVVSSWEISQKGVLQGFHNGPFLFSILINDLLDFIEHGTLYNSSGDNTLSYADQYYNILINVLEKESSILRERPFNLKGGGYGFFSKKIF